MKKKRKLKKFVLVIIVLLILFLASALAYSYFIKEDSAVKDLIETIIKPEETPVTIVNVDSTSRPYAVMINNISTARPYHSGLQEAYITYEIIVEGGITRYMALYKDVEVDVIGSVRSARHYFIDYVMENDAYYVHWGWSPQAQDDISEYDIDNINAYYYENSYFYREDLPISYEHTGYTTLSLLETAVSDLGYRTETNQDLLFEYSADPVDYKEQNTANNIDITFSYLVTSNFVYDEENEYYLMSVNDVAHTDYITGEQYHYKNIITYRIENSTIEGETYRQEIDNIGSGEGYYFSNGAVIEITWEKTSRESQTIYKIKSTGEELVINDGNTYIGIQPLDEDLSIY